MNSTRHAPYLYTYFPRCQSKIHISRSKVRMSGLCKVEISGSIGRGDADGTGANRLEPEGTEPIESVARGRARTFDPGRGWAAAKRNRPPHPAAVGAAAPAGRPHRQRVKSVHVWRERRAAFGELVMWHSSPYAWLEDRGPESHLIVMIDDATSRIWGRFAEHDSTEENFRVLQGWLRRHGLPAGNVRAPADPLPTLRAGTSGPPTDRASVFGLVHHAHAAATQPFQDAVVGDRLADHLEGTQAWAGILGRTQEASQRPGEWRATPAMASTWEQK